MFGISSVDGVLGDLGVSSHQFDAKQNVVFLPEVMLRLI